MIMVTQVAILKRSDEHCFKPKFQGISGLLEKPLSLLEVGEAKGKVSPTFCPADYRSSSPCPLLWWVDERWWRSSVHHRGSTQLFTHMDGEQYHQPQGAMSGAVYLVGRLCSRWFCETKFLFSFMLRLGTTTKLTCDQSASFQGSRPSTVVYSYYPNLSSHLFLWFCRRNTD